MGKTERVAQSSPGQWSCRSWSMEGGSHSEHPLFTPRSYPGTASIRKTWQTWFQELQPLDESQVLSSPLLFSVCIDFTNIFEWLQSWRARSVVLVDASILLNNLTVITKPTKKTNHRERNFLLPPWQVSGTKLWNPYSNLWWMSEMPVTKQPPFFFSYICWMAQHFRNQVPV